MIDHEAELFNIVARKLREKYGANNIYVIGEEVINEPPRYPSISIVQSDNIINDKYSTFKEQENVAIETYKVEVVSKDSEQSKEIVDLNNEVFKEHNYLRTYNQPVFSVNTSNYRRIARFINKNSI